MATAPPSASEALAVGEWRDDGQEESKSERYLAKRLAAAGADYKGVAWITFLLALAVAALAWGAAGVVLEHWLVVGGLPRWARWTWLLTGFAALAAAIGRWGLPLLRYRVNLVYAARAIEREHPELHNDLVNTVLVKARPDSNPATVVRSLERRTAKRLSAMPAETVMDRSAAVRLALALAALVAVTCLYALTAPKSAVTTALRLLAPWSRVAAPTRVGIASPRLSWRIPGEDGGDAGRGAGPPGREIPCRDGAATVVRGRQVVVSTALRGLRRDERPTLVVIPAAENGGDGVAAGWRAEMTRGREAGEAVTFQAVLPDATRGIDGGLSFTIEAGDARTEPLRIAVVDSPTLLVREVRYEYPKYMHRENETVAWQGDLRGVEGTRVYLLAESNQPLEAAWIDFDCDGDVAGDLKLKVQASDLTRASGSFMLALDAARAAPEHASYRLVFQPRGTAAARSQLETEKIEHRIEVLPDLVPEISIEEPRESPLRVPPQAPLTVRVRALDADFGLARVAIETRLQGGGQSGELVLPGSDARGVFTGGVQIIPERLGAGPGGVIEYRGVADDTRPKEPNVARTPWQVLQIDAAAPPRQPEKPLPPEQQGGAEGDDKDAGDGQPNETEAEDRQPPDRGGRQPRDGGGRAEKGAADRGGKPEGDDRGDPPQRPDDMPAGDAGGDRGNQNREQPGDRGGGQRKPREERGQDGADPEKNPRKNDQGQPKPGDAQGAAEGAGQGDKRTQDNQRDAGRQRGQSQQPGGEGGEGGES